MNKKTVGIAGMVGLALIIAGCVSVSQDGPTVPDEAEKPQVAAATVATEVESETDAPAEVQAVPATETTAQEAAVEEATAAVEVEPEDEEEVAAVEVEPAVEAAAEEKPATVAPILPKLENELAEGEYRWNQLLGRDSIYPIYDPQFATAEDAPYADDELVIGVEINGEAKAYAIGPLNSREMVNDTVGGVPVLVTW